MTEADRSQKDLIDQLRANQQSPESLGGHSSGSGTSRCYRVQARTCCGCGPKEMVGAKTSMNRHILTDAKWETLFFPKASIGVPPAPFSEEYARHGYYSYAAAQALRWWFLAEQGALVSFETRLVEYTFKYSFSAEPVRPICLIDPEMREDMMPDWGKAPGEKTAND